MALPTTFLYAVYVLYYV